MARIERIDSATAGLLDRIAPDVFDAAIDPARLAEVVARPDHLLFVAVDGGTVVGQALGMVLCGPDRDPTLYVDNLGVAPSHRRQGIATALMWALAKAGRSRGATSLWLAADPDSDTALPFYRALGYGFRSAEFAEVDLDA